MDNFTEQGQRRLETSAREWWCGTTLVSLLLSVTLRIKNASDQFHTHIRLWGQKGASGLIQTEHREFWFEFRLVHKQLFPSFPCCRECTEWPYDVSMLSNTQDGLMTCPCSPVHRMVLWPVHAVQCTEWPYDMSMLFSAQNGLMTCPCCSVHRMALWHVHAVQ